MHSKLHFPLVKSILPHVPVIPQSIGNHISLRTHLGSTDGIASEAQSFDFIFGLIVPKMHASI